ncbi:MAG: DNRLRE domain-containing protein [Planctomycetota bacterium]|nr:DNRLRE domain-containing protein [Planctomycetota bacterium]
MTQTRSLIVGSFVLIGTFAGSAATADLVVLDSVAHGTLYDTSGAPLANGLGRHLFAGKNGQNLARRGLLRFDLAGLGAEVVVESVILRLHVSQANAAATEVDLHRVTSDWGVGSTDAPGGEGGGGPATAGSATWNESFFGQTAWATAGGDFDAVTSASSIVAGGGWYEWSGQGLVDDLQSVVDGTAANFGWILLGDESGASTAKRFDSMFADEPFRPELLVEFTVVPTPGAVALLTLAGLSPCVRRRRA